MLHKQFDKIHGDLGVAPACVPAAVRISAPNFTAYASE